MHINAPLRQKALCESGMILGTGIVYPGENIHTRHDLSDTSRTSDIFSALSAIEGLKIGALISIGGGNTLRAMNFMRLLSQDMEYRPSLILIPKTAENDLFGVNNSLGFNTAAEETGRELQRIMAENRSKNTYLFAELPGFSTGWYTTYVSLFAQASKAFIPEQFDGIELNLERLTTALMRTIAERERSGREGATFCFSSGLRGSLPADGTFISDGREISVDLSRGIADILASAMHQISADRKNRIFISRMLEYPEGLLPNMTDVETASKLALRTFDILAGGGSGVMVSDIPGRETGIPFEELLDEHTFLPRLNPMSLSESLFDEMRSLSE